MQPQKVSSLPAPGLSIATPLGHLFYWITGNVLYWFKVENGSSPDQALALAASLVPVG
jgi:hypothetical protein